MKSTYLYLSLALLTLALLTSCGPDATKPTPEVTALTLSATTAQLSVGETLQLTASVAPADAKVTFTTDNAAVATVCEKGIVKAIAPGTATITAKAGDKKATCTITVEEKKVEEKNVSLFNKLDGKKYPSGSTIDYAASVSTEDASFYALDLFFSVLKTAKYKVTLTFDKATSGSACIGTQCENFSGKSYTTNATLVADDLESDLKGKGDMTSLGTHLDLSTPAGETYKNRMTIQLKPEDGSETLQWTVNLAIAVK